jgi:hypothetical protein
LITGVGGEIRKGQLKPGNNLTLMEGTALSEHLDEGVRLVPLSGVAIEVHRDPVRTCHAVV